MIFNFFFYLFIVLEVVISESVESISNGKNNEPKRKSLFSIFFKEKRFSLLLSIMNNHLSMIPLYLKSKTFFFSNKVSNLKIIKSILLPNCSTLDNDKNTLVTNDNPNTLSMTEKSKTLESSILERIKDDFILKEIFNALPKDMPTVLIDIMGDYSKYHNDTIDEFYNRIRNELASVTGRTILDLYDPSFMSSLLKLVRDNKEKFSSSHDFWYDLERLLFKYALSMREKFANNDELFEK